MIQCHWLPLGLLPGYSNFLDIERGGAQDVESGVVIFWTVEKEKISMINPKNFCSRTVVFTEDGFACVAIGNTPDNRPPGH